MPEPEPTVSLPDGLSHPMTPDDLGLVARPNLKVVMFDYPTEPLTLQSA